jgi:copper homeostasis protein
MTIEICTNGLQSCINAEKGGANRVELCDNLFEGGTTPSLATIQLAKKYLSIAIFVMIRPRGGDFCYSDLEFEIMQLDIENCKKVGVEGVVFGLLNPNGTIDKARTQQLIELARPMKVTFHRAFDMCENHLAALADLIEIGVNNLLTSGGQNKAVDGLPLLKKIIEKADNRIEIMVGSGVRPNNVERFKSIGITNFHLSGIHEIESKMQFRNPTVSMGSLPEIPEYNLRVTDEAVVRAMLGEM